MIKSLIDIEKCKSYATVANLEKALVKFGFHEDRYVIAYTSTGRATAIFLQSNFKDGGYIMLYSQHGFATVG